MKHAGQNKTIIKSQPTKKKSKKGSANRAIEFDLSYKANSPPYPYFTAFIPSRNDSTISSAPRKTWRSTKSASSRTQGLSGSPTCFRWTTTSM